MKDNNMKVLVCRNLPVPRIVRSWIGMAVRKASLLWILLTCAALVLLTKPIFYIYVEEHEDLPISSPQRLWGLRSINSHTESSSLTNTNVDESRKQIKTINDLWASRLKAVNETCQMKFGGTSPSVDLGDSDKFNSSIANAFQNILVDDNLKVLYCVVPKVACTNWKRVLVLLSGRLNLTTAAQVRGIRVHDKTYMRFMGLRHLNEYGQSDIKHIINTYFKFMFVRDPFERLLSAFRDKFTQHDKWSKYFQKRYGRKIIQRFRSKPTWHSLHYGNDVQFEEFIKYLVEKSKAGLTLNPHWATYHSLCQPCYINYDVIGKFETLEEDAKAIINKISPTFQYVNFPPSWSLGPVTHDIMEEYFRTLSREDIRELYMAYQMDFNMFQYKTPYGWY